MMGSRPTAGHQTLDLVIGVRIPASQRNSRRSLFDMAHSSSGLGRWPLTSATGVRVPYALQICSRFTFLKAKNIIAFRKFLMCYTPVLLNDIYRINPNERIIVPRKWIPIVAALTGSNSWIVSYFLDDTAIFQKTTGISKNTNDVQTGKTPFNIQPKIQIKDPTRNTW